MKASIFLLSALLFLSACSGKTQKTQKIASENGFAVLPKPAANEAVATFAGGCFWAMQESLIQLKGVNTAISGYAGGMTDNPNYEEVSGQQTGHAESVQVYYDPSVISYEQLLKAFFTAHDPTELNRQGPDVGPEYRSVAFYRNPQELKMIGRVMTAMEHKNHNQGSFVTEMEPFKAFYPAESSHQNYYERNTWDPYIRSVSRPKVMHVREELPQLIKAEYLK
ncbi:peptide-methionine (S)-S-oxide reductase [Pedobacter westerhofensis]|uniref:Peptide methionine sulfoxide reductase MsrA n=1 Tax=Pedobacter westerhofensis TaxID=425512 RepID=A0A521FP30_9SPHI|nr:peptide-methionine (S)-S-oxide reductase MsrA [Pedobacter westerhofensis]SMO97963.1 peptide-methionine (S)-S-oxide reductase [Pedobacter westerhofensis]